ncbi:MAG TPA: hypothetical protein VIU12_05480 [Chryseolinea sp.]
MEWKLTGIKTVHTVIWVGFNIILFYLLYAVTTNKIDMWVWMGVSAVLLEGVVLAIFKLTCPLTLLARKYSASASDNFDIYLPNWMARNTKRIYTTMFVVILGILAYQLVTG